jgi:hypothetical protein
MASAARGSCSTRFAASALSATNARGTSPPDQGSMTTPIKNNNKTPTVFIRDADYTGTVHVFVLQNAALQFGGSDLEPFHLHNFLRQSILSPRTLRRSMMWRTFRRSRINTSPSSLILPSSPVRTQLRIQGEAGQC